MISICWNTGRYRCFRDSTKAKRTAYRRRTPTCPRKRNCPYRRALAYVLRCHRPLWWELRRALADLIWEDEVPCQRRIVFEKKGRGQYRDHTRTTAIARMVLEQIKAGASQAAAIAETSYNLQIELRQVQRIWARYRPGFEWLGELPPSNRDTKSRKKTVAKHRSQRT